jgi:hypothetical protein
MEPVAWSKYPLAAAMFPGDGPYLASILVLGLFTVLTCWIYYPSWFRQFHDAKSIYELGGFHFLHAIAFFSKRYEFLRSQFEQTGQKLFQFRILQVSSVFALMVSLILNGIKHRVVALSGEVGREAFFTNRHLDLSEGYKILYGGVCQTLSIWTG